MNDIESSAEKQIHNKIVIRNAHKFWQDQEQVLSRLASQRGVS